MAMQKGQGGGAKEFAERLEKDPQLRQEVLKSARDHMMKVASSHGYKMDPKELYEELRKKWGGGRVPSADQVDEKDDPDTCCCCTFSESPEI